MLSLEQIHRYPRRIIFVVNLLCIVAVLLVLGLLARQVIQVIWRIVPVDLSLFDQLPGSKALLLRLVGAHPACCESPIQALQSLIAPLVLLAVTLLVVLILRHVFATIRTSARGILIEFAGSWLPVAWDAISAIKVTEVNQRFVLLIETNGQYLTGWHRLYSLIYRLGYRRAFLVTSSIQDFDALVKTLLAETDRVARVLAGQGARLDEAASSPFFRLIMNPAAFFSQRTAPANTVSTAAKPAADDPGSAGVYPPQIGMLLRGGGLILGLLICLRYLNLVLGSLAVFFPAVRGLPVFSWVNPGGVGDPWRMLLSAHLVMLVGALLVGGIRYLLPDLQARPEGIGVRYFKRWHLVPWNQITDVKVTELSEQSQIVSIQTKSRLPFPARLSTALYDGGWRSGILMTSALSTFDLLLKRIILEVMGGPTSARREQQIFQSHARSNLLFMLLSPQRAIDQLVEESQSDPETKQLKFRAIAGPAGTMAALALVPALILGLDRVVGQGNLPDLRLLTAMVALFVFGMLEWPIVVLASIAVAESTSGGEQGGRAWSLYPTSQLPRILGMLGILVLVILAVPVLPVLAWFGMMVWIFILAAGLWSALYDWSGGQLVAGGLIPVFVQMLVLIAYLLVR